MNTSIANTIERLFLEVNTSSLPTAYGIKDTIDEFISQHLLPVLEEYLDQYPGLEQVQFNLEELTLTIDVHQKDWQFELLKHWETQLANQLGPLIAEHLENGSQALQTEENAQPLLYFLEYGLMPWWIENPKSTSATEAWIYDQLESEALKKKVIEKIDRTRFRQRLVKQLNDGFLLSFLGSSNSKASFWSSSKKQKWNALIKNASASLKPIFWEMILLLQSKHGQALFEVANSLRKKLKKKSTASLAAQNLGLIRFLIEAARVSQNTRSKSVRTTLESLLNLEQQFLAENKSSQKGEQHPRLLGDKTKEPNEEKGFQANERLESLNNKDEVAEIETKKGDSPTDQELAINDPHTAVDGETSIKISKENELLESAEPTTNAIDISDRTKKDHTEEPPLESALKQVDAEDIADDPKTYPTEKKTEGNQLEGPLFAEELLTDFELAEGTFEAKELMEKPFYMEHCGFLLIHPFLTAFLKNCELLDDNNKLKDKNKAAELFYYTATGRDTAYEHQLHFFKFLCDIPRGFPMNRNFELSDRLKAKADELLEAVLGHLPQLGSSSIDLLRNEFLCREGKLNLGTSNKVIVSRKTQDLLLQNLPWSLSVVKLPWHKKLTYLEW